VPCVEPHAQSVLPPKRKKRYLASHSRARDSPSPRRARWETRLVPAAVSFLCNHRWRRQGTAPSPETLAWSEIRDKAVARGGQSPQQHWARRGQAKVFILGTCSNLGPNDFFLTASLLPQTIGTLFSRNNVQIIDLISVVFHFLKTQHLC
jgi:hypothetical protein